MPVNVGLPVTEEFIVKKGKNQGAEGSPNPVAVSSPAVHISVETDCRYSRVVSALPCQSLAASPLMCGVAIEVPDIVV